jgi:hypothetical protein
VGRHRGQRGHIARADVLRQRPADQFKINVQTSKLTPRTGLGDDEIQIETPMESPLLSSRLTLEKERLFLRLAAQARPSIQKHIQLTPAALDESSPEAAV